MINTARGVFELQNIHQVKAYGSRKLKTWKKRRVNNAKKATGTCRGKFRNRKGRNR